MIMRGKRGVIMGVANDRSIAWAIAQALHAEGASLAFSFQGEKLEKRVVPLAASVSSEAVFECNVAKEGDVARFFGQIQELWPEGIDFVLHSIAFADKEALKEDYLQTTRAQFQEALDVSCYSFTEVAREALPFLREGASLLTMSYLGAEKVMPHYNVMGVAKAALEASVRYLAMDLGRQGVRVNALSAGPIRTLAASGIGDFPYILQWNQYNAPLRRNVTLEDVGRSGLYLLSPLSSGVTGEVHHVDSGYNIVGMKAIDAPDIAKACS